ncbi:DUF4112 domain-containing protein [Haloarcula litorea]|uniref:DUF4112 domain-containing protein n=1 Tax=Haloarcula litorea TaxID=3032579 RepID=UPI0023E8CAEC|nr:DUF4112 domain-containing protein [Halomicroarcula sp. GDY20]
MEVDTDALPADADERAVERIRVVATVLDDGIELPGLGFRVGLDPLVGLLPVAGDLLTALCSLYVVVEAYRLGVSTPTLARMCLNILLDLFAGSVPLVGDAFDAVWKANVRNVDLAVAELAAD